MIVTLEEAKGYLRVDFDDDDALLEGIIVQSQQICMDVARFTDLLASAEQLVADVARVEVSELSTGYSEKFRIAALYATAYLYEHREEADHNALTLSLRSFLCGERRAGF